jgi:hypothetical protein
MSSGAVIIAHVEFQQTLTELPGTESTRTLERAPPQVGS